MITKHVKIKQLDVQSLKLNSNSDKIILDSEITINLEDSTYKLSCIPTNIEPLIIGFISAKLNHKHKPIITKENLHYSISFNDESYPTIQNSPLTDISYPDIIMLNRLFKSGQKTYHDTGATMSVGTICASNELILFEDISITNALYKLIGYCLMNQQSIHGKLFISHSISNSHIPLIDFLNPQLLITQSSVTSTIIDYCHNHNVTLFGFCRKNSYNLYSNYHI